jgi:hypothetical protein
VAVIGLTAAIRMVERRRRSAEAEASAVATGGAR